MLWPIEFRNSLMIEDDSRIGKSGCPGFFLRPMSLKINASILLLLPSFDASGRKQFSGIVCFLWQLIFFAFGLPAQRPWYQERHYELSTCAPSGNLIHGSHTWHVSVLLLNLWRTCYCFTTGKYLIFYIYSFPRRQTATLLMHLPVSIGNWFVWGWVAGPTTIRSVISFWARWFGMDADLVCHPRRLASAPIFITVDPKSLLIGWLDLPFKSILVSYV